MVMLLMLIQPHDVLVELGRLVFLINLKIQVSKLAGMVDLLKAKKVFQQEDLAVQVQVTMKFIALAMV